MAPADPAPAVTCVFERILQAWEYARVEGLISAGDARIETVRLVDGDMEPVTGGNANLEEHEPGSAYVRVTISCLTDRSALLADHFLEVAVAGADAPAHIRLGDYLSTSVELPELPTFVRFRELIAAHPAPRMLEIGGRDRSGISHRDRVGAVSEYVGLDVLPGEGVDVVADAHSMSEALGRNRFDFACSYFVWEHLAMPWKVVIELNRVLVDGGYAYIVAPQTCGLHDLPWDYFRFSDSAFRALFAAETGFEVIDVVRNEPMHIFPFHTRRAYTDDEQTAGFFNVIALVRKVGETTLEWPVDPAGIAQLPYPE